MHEKSRRKPEVMSIRPLPKPLQEKAEAELNEVTSRIQEDVDNIKEWISKQPHLQIKRGDQWFLTYLRGSKFSLQQAKQKFNVYCTLRIKTLEYFGNRDPFQSDIQECLKEGGFVILPESQDILAPRRFLIRSKNLDPDKVLLTTIIKTTVMIIDILTLDDDACVINGQEVIIDLKDTPYSYVGQVSPSVLKTIVSFLQNAYSTRFKGLHFINTPPFLHTILKLFQSLLSEKIRDRIHYYSEENVGKIYDFIPKSELPEEYGGQAGPMLKLANDLKLRVESYSDWFIEDSEYTFTEKHLPISEKSSDTFNMEDSFRQLNID